MVKGEQVIVYGQSCSKQSKLYFDPLQNFEEIYFGLNKYIAVNGFPMCFFSICLKLNASTGVK